MVKDAVNLNNGLRNPGRALVVLLVASLFFCSCRGHNVGVIEVKASDPATEWPLVFGKATIPELEREMECDSSGHVFLSEVPAGTHLVRVEMEGYAVGSTWAEVVSHETTSVEVFLSRPWVGGSVTGTIVNKLTRHPLEGQFVNLAGTRIVTHTDSLGRYCIRNAPPGAQELYVHGMLFDPDTVDVTVVPGETTTVDLKLVPRRGMITGTVADSVTGKGLPEASLSAFFGSGVCMIHIDKRGEYRIPNLNPGSWIVVVDARGYGSPDTAEAMVRAGEITTLDFSLSPDTYGSFAVTGQVVDSLTGKGLPGAFVLVTEANLGSYSDGLGYYSINGLASGEYSVKAELEGYATVINKRWANMGAEDTVNLPLYLLPEVARIEGLVTDSATGKPLSDVKITAHLLMCTGLGYERRTVSRNDGSYFISDIRPGLYSVGARKEGFGKFENRKLSVDVRQPAVADLKLRPIGYGRGTVIILVVDAETGEPISRANVGIHRGISTRGTSMDTSGRYVLLDVPPGTYTTSAGKKGYIGSERRNIQVGAGKTTNVEFSLNRGEEPPRLSATGKITGRVVDDSTGAPLPLVNVLLLDIPTKGAVSGNDGYYYLIGVPPGKYRLLARMMGYHEFVAESVKVTADQTTNVHIGLRRVAVDFGDTH
jgi:hypothetical protein